MSKIIKVAILFLALGGGTVLLSGCTLFKGKYLPLTDANLEIICCQECAEFMAEMPGAEKCVANEEIEKKCQEFFEKNPTKDNKECMEGKINTLPDVVIPGQPDGTIIPGEERQDEETAEYYEFKRKYENKKWRGTMSGESATTMGGAGSCKQTYTARIDEMKMIFNGPYGDPGLYRNGDLLSSIEIGGKAVLVSSHISCTCGELNVEISSFPFNLAGNISLSEKTINFGAADPEADKEFKVFYVATCDPGGSFYGDNEVLWNLFKPSYTTLEFDGDKMILSAAVEKGSMLSSSSNFKISGELVPF